MPLTDLISPLPRAIGPATRISGVGLTLLSRTNQFGQVIGRSRPSARNRRGTAGTDRQTVLLKLETPAERVGDRGAKSSSIAATDPAS